MKTYTLMIYRPEGQLLPRLEAQPNFRKSSAEGQWIVWDGPAKRRDIVNLYEILSPYCSGISLTAGSREVQKSIRQQGVFA